MSVVKYVTIRQLAAQAKRSTRQLHELKKGGILKAEKMPGVKGYRITVANANRFLAHHWPGTPLFEEE